MARTPSNMVNLGTLAPSFKLLNTINNELVISDNYFNKNGTIIMFICNHCPFVIHVLDEIVSITKKYDKEISFIAISSNDIVNYPEDSPELMKKLAEEKKFNFPYLYDETQEVAKKYDAVCTPDFFGYNEKLELQYRGRMRELKELKPVRSGDSDLFTALKMISETGNGPKEQIPSMGCNIKWVN